MFDFGSIISSILAAIAQAFSGRITEIIGHLFGGPTG